MLIRTSNSMLQLYKLHGLLLSFVPLPFHAASCQIICCSSVVVHRQADQHRQEGTAPQLCRHVLALTRVLALIMAWGYDPVRTTSRTLDEKKSGKSDPKDVRSQEETYRTGRVPCSSMCLPNLAGNRAPNCHRYTCAHQQMVMLGILQPARQYVTCSALEMLKSTVLFVRQAHHLRWQHYILLPHASLPSSDLSR